MTQANLTALNIINCIVSTPERLINSQIRGVVQGVVVINCLLDFPPSTGGEAVSKCVTCPDGTAPNNSTGACSADPSDLTYVIGQLNAQAAISIITATSVSGVGKAVTFSARPGAACKRIACKWSRSVLCCINAS